MDYGNVDKETLTRLKPGDPCPLHDRGSCTVKTVASKGRVIKSVYSAECEMPLWTIALGDSNPLCVNRRGHRWEADYGHER